MTEIVDDKDLTPPNADGWQVWYRVRRSDGGEVDVEASCTGTADQVARNYQARDGLSFIADRGRRAALDHAERVQSPLVRGKTIVRLFVSTVDGSVSASEDYEKPL